MRHTLKYCWTLPNTLLGCGFTAAVLLTGGRARIVDGVLEAHGGVAATALPRLPIGGGAAAITFGHVVLAPDAVLLRVTRAHERVHVRQYEVWGPLFIPAYLLASLWALLIGAGAYRGNYFERAARAAARH